MGVLILAVAGAGFAGASCRRAAAKSASRSDIVSPDFSGSTGPTDSAESPQPAAKAAAAEYPFTPAERAAVADFLRRNPALRVATDEDRRKGSDADAELRGLYGVYHPYFVRGDLDDDGVLDFVLAFVRRDSGKSAPWFSIVVFTGKPGAAGTPAGFSAGAILERDVTLARGDLAVDRDAVVITPDLDEEDVRRYRWDPIGRTFVFVRDDEEPTESQDVSRTTRRDSSRSLPPAAGSL